MSLFKQLDEKTGVFKTIADMRNSSPNLGAVTMLKGSGSLSFYVVETVDDGGELSFTNGLFANVVSSSPQVVLPQTVSGTLVASGRINQIRDSGAFTLPLSSSVPVDTILVVELPNRYKDSTPTVTRSGADTIIDGDGPQTSIIFAGPVRLTLTSNGSNEWSL